MVQDILSTLVAINVDNNRITQLSISDLQGCTALRALLMSDNPVVRADAAAFSELTSMAVVPSAFTPVRDFNGGFYISAVDYAESAFGNRVLTHTPLSLGSWPQSCEWVGPLVNDLSCAECTFGYVSDGTMCIWPTFGVRADAWNQTAFEDDPQMSGRGSDGRRVLLLRRRIELNPPAVTLNPKHSFVGYTNGDYTG
jgi:hypothetical protein